MVKLSCLVNEVLAGGISVLYMFVLLRQSIGVAVLVVPTCHGLLHMQYVIKAWFTLKCFRSKTETFRYVYTFRLHTNDKAFW